MIENDVVEVVITCPDAESSQSIAAHLIEARLAACTQAMDRVSSSYRWNGKVENDPEVRLAIHTRSRLVNEVHTAIDRLHPYDLPCFLVIDVKASLGYARWVAEEVK